MVRRLWIRSDLFFLQCKICGSSPIPKRTRLAFHYTITAPLDGPSGSLISKVAMSCGIESNTSMPHITFIEGLLPNKKHLSFYLQQLKSPRMALLVDPSIQILEIHSVPGRSDDTTVLIVANTGVRQP
jgi:hypothetical protein